MTHEPDRFNEMLTEPERDMIQGYMDGLDLEQPEPGPNRSPAYRHCFANGRDDRNHTPRASAQALREQADRVIEQG